MDAIEGKPIADGQAPIANEKKAKPFRETRVGSAGGTKPITPPLRTAVKVSNLVSSMWRLGRNGKLDGSRAGVRAALLAQTDIPEIDRQWMAARLDARPAEHNYVTLHGHWVELEGHAHFDFDLKSARKL